MLAQGLQVMQTELQLKCTDKLEEMHMYAERTYQQLGFLDGVKTAASSTTT